MRATATRPATTRRLGVLLRALALCALTSVATASHAGLPRLCNSPDHFSPAEKDRVFRFGAIVKRTLDESGQRVALIARSGLDLKRFEQRYSHAGITLKHSANAPWSVRQLYYACDDEQPRLFDQGISGFVLGSDQPAVGYISLVFLPAAQADALERTALDKARALQLLHSRYSANAHAFDVLYQNCNQWVAELLATAWGGVGDDSNPVQTQRIAAQQWLKSQGYTPSVMTVGFRPLMWLGTALPWLHNDDHPRADLEQGLYRVSMPASIEAFVRQQVPEAQRVELCHNQRHVVLRRGWTPMADGCEAGPEDTVIPLD